MLKTSDEHIRILGDVSRSRAERRAAFDALRQTGAGVIGDLRAAGLLPTPVWPSREAARMIEGDDLLLAVCLPLEHLVEVLASPAEDVERLVLGVRLAGALASYDQVSAARLEPLVRALLGDVRSAFPYLPDRSSPLGAYAQEYHRVLAAATAAGDKTRHAELIESAIPASLARGREVGALYGLFHDGLRLGMPPVRLATLLLEVLADKTATPAARIAARMALDVLAGLAHHPDGAPEGMSAAMETARQQAGAILGNILRDLLEPAALREQVAAQLFRWAPGVHVQLQREGVLPVEPVPSRRLHRDWSPAGIEALARRVSFDEILTLLRGPHEKELDQVITALRLAPAFAAWLPDAIDQLVPLFVALLPSRIPVPMKSGQRLLGEMTLEQFPALFPPLDSQTPGRQQALADGLTAARNAGLDLSRIKDWAPGLLSRATRRKLGL